MRRQCYGLFILAFLFLSGCSGIEHRSEAVPKRALPSVAKAKDQPQLLWSNTTSSGVAGRDAKLNLAMTHEVLIAADAKGKLFALDRKNGQVKWRINTAFPITSGPTIVQDAIIIGTRDAHVAAYNLEDGKLRWETLVPGEVLAAPKGFRNVVYVNTLGSSLIALRLEDGRELWRYSLNAPSIVLRQSSSPVITESHILGGFANGRLVALHRDGTVEWEREISIPKGRSDIQRMSDLSADPVVMNGMVYAVNYQGQLTALSLETGNPIWEKEMSSYSGLTVAGSSLFVSDAKGRLFAIDRRTGKTLWEQPMLEGRRLTKPVAWGNLLIVGDSDGYLHWFSQQGGSYINRLSFDGKGIDTSPVLMDNQLYALGRSGKIAVFNLNPLAITGE